MLELPDRPDHTQQKQNSRNNSGDETGGWGASRATFFADSVNFGVSVVFVSVSVAYDQVAQVVPIHEADVIHEVHELDPVHHIDHKDEHPSHSIA